MFHFLVCLETSINGQREQTTSSSCCFFSFFSFSSLLYRFSAAGEDTRVLSIVCSLCVSAVALSYYCYLLIATVSSKDSVLTQMWKMHRCYLCLPLPLPPLRPPASTPSPATICRVLSPGSLQQPVQPPLTSCTLPLTWKWWWDSKSCTETMHRGEESERQGE